MAIRFSDYSSGSLDYSAAYANELNCIISGQTRLAGDFPAFRPKKLQFLVKRLLADEVQSTGPKNCNIQMSRMMFIMKTFEYFQFNSAGVRWMFQWFSADNSQRVPSSRWYRRSRPNQLQIWRPTLEMRVVMRAIRSKKVTINLYDDQRISFTQVERSWWIIEPHEILIFLILNLNI